MKYATYMQEQLRSKFNTVAGSMTDVSNFGSQCVLEVHYTQYSLKINFVFEKLCWLQIRCE